MATKIFHGGRRLGAGRKPKSGIPGDVTSMMRIPQSDKKAVQDFLIARRVLVLALIMKTIRQLHRTHLLYLCPGEA